MKNLIILRGCSGSGKSTFGHFLVRLSNGYISNIAADDFFYKDGKYQFDVTKLGQAHASCIRQVEEDMKENVDICVSNTSTTEKELKPYLELAEKYDYKVISLVVENRHGNKNIHDVPDDTIKNQAERLKNSIKLI